MKKKEKRKNIRQKKVDDDDHGVGCETKTWIKCRGARSRSRNDISITPDAMTEARVCYRARGIKAVRDKGRKKKRESKSGYIYM